MQAEHDQREAADGEADQQHLAGADMIGEIADRGLRQPGHHAEHGQRKAKLDIADAELLLQEREQHRQHEQMEMADPMGDRNPRQRAKRAASDFSLLRCGENVDHVVIKTPVAMTARQGGPKIPADGYLSMNTAAWRPRERRNVPIIKSRGETKLRAHLHGRRLPAGSEPRLIRAI